jgi:hypothetical protein
MSRGDFNNIKPTGKPLHERNPHYMDFTTYKINEILIDNGRIKFFELQILIYFLKLSQVTSRNGFFLKNKFDNQLTKHE